MTLTSIQREGGRGVEQQRLCSEVKSRGDEEVEREG